jgi:predicted porin
LNVNKSLEGTTVGVSYNFGIITAGIDKKKSKGRFVTTTAEVDTETDQTGYGLAYAITPTLTLGANYTKANTTGITTSVLDEKYRSIALGYNLGPVVAEVQYGQYQNAKGIDTADFNSTFARLSTKF